MRWMYKLLSQCVVAAAQQELTSELESNDTNTDENSQLSLQSASMIAKNCAAPVLKTALYTT